MRHFILRDKAVIDRACAYLQSLAGAEELFAVLVTPASKKRTLEQNDRLHKKLRTIAEEGWLNGRQGTVIDWKAYLLVGLGFVDTYTDLTTGEVRVSPQSTSAMSVKRLCELTEAIDRYAAAELGLVL